MRHQSLSNEDRKEILRQKWAEAHGPVSKEEFTGVVMTKPFFDFLDTASVKEFLENKASSLSF